MDYFNEGSPETVIDDARVAASIDAMLARMGPLRRVLLLPPDITRRHSGAGAITVMLHERLLAEGAHIEIMPALGTHVPMTSGEIDAMFPGVPHGAFRTHDWRRDLVHLGDVPGGVVREITGGRLSFPIRCEINRLLVEGGWDRIFSIGQLVPHEVAGIANHNKNVFVGVGGADTIDKTHFIGAVCGMERIMGRARTPVRDVFDTMSERFTKGLPLTYVLTVRSPDVAGRTVTRGLFAGDDKACFDAGARLCRQVNLTLLDMPLKTVVVHLDKDEFKSTWLGNKAIYRTRMAMADGGRLIVLAPGVARFGEDPQIDRLIRRHGYRGTPHTLARVEDDPELRANLSAAAHLIHGSAEGRFEIVYCAGGLSREEIESVGFGWGDLGETMRRYAPDRLRDGINTLPDGEGIYFISNPAQALWGVRQALEDTP